MGERLRRGGSINIFRFIKTLVLFKEGYQNGSTIRLSSHLGDVSGCLVQIKFCLQLYLIKHTDGCPDGKHQLNLQFVHFINFDRGTTIYCASIRPGLIWNVTCSSHCVLMKQVFQSVNSQ